MKLKNTILYSGWIAAAAMAVVMVGSGFQAAQEKSGVIDMNQVIQNSNVGKKNSQKLKDSITARTSLIDMVETYPVMTTEQAESLKQLMLKEVPTAADKAAVEKIKGDLLASDKKRSELMGKSTLTESERQLLTEYSQRVRANEQRLDVWQREFSNEISDIRDGMMTDLLTAAKSSLKDVAKQQGFNTVFNSEVAPYGANDLTDATVKALDAKK